MKWKHKSFPIERYRPWTARKNPIDWLPPDQHDEDYDSTPVKTNKTKESVDSDDDKTPVKSNEAKNGDKESSVGYHKMREITKRAQRSIEALMDQPGDCLRDGLDCLNFEELVVQSLSDISPPGFSEEEWLLVDSAEKMRQCIQELKVCDIKLLCIHNLSLGSAQHSKLSSDSGLSTYGDCV